MSGSAYIPKEPLKMFNIVNLYTRRNGLKWTSNILNIQYFKNNLLKSAVAFHMFFEILT